MSAPVLRVGEVAAGLSSSDARLAAAACESLHRAVAAEGFGRFQLEGSAGVRAQKAATFPAAFAPLVSALLQCVSVEGACDAATVKHAAASLAILVRASKAFARWIYTVPTFVRVTLRRLQRAAAAADAELATRLVRMLAHIASLDKKVCFVLRLEGGIKILMQCVGNGGGSATRAASANASEHASLASAAAASASASVVTSTAAQKQLRLLVELILTVVKANEQNSAAIVTQALPHVGNLLCTLRNQSGQPKIFQATLQVVAELCKEKKVVAALIGTTASAASAAALDSASSAAASASASAASPSAPVTSPAVVALLQSLGPGVTSFMGWCIATLLHSKLENVNVLLRLIFQLAASKAGFASLLAHGGVESLLPSLASQLHKPVTARAIAALLWQQQRQQYGHLVPKLDPLYQFHRAGVRVHFHADGRVQRMEEWEAESLANQLARTESTGELAATATSGAVDPEAAEADLDDGEESLLDSLAAEQKSDANTEAAPSLGELTDDASHESTLAATPASPSSAHFLPPLPAPTAFAAPAAASLAPPSTHDSDDDDDLPKSARAPPSASNPPSDDEAEEAPESAGSSGGEESEDEHAADTKVAAAAAVKKSALLTPGQSAIPTPLPTPLDLEKVKSLLAQAISPAPALGPSSADPLLRLASPPPPAPKLGLAPGDAEFAWSFSPELWDPEDAATATRVAAELALVQSARYATPRSVKPFVVTMPSPFFRNEHGVRVPGLAPPPNPEPLSEVDPGVMIDAMRAATVRFERPETFMGRIVYDREAGGSQLPRLEAEAAANAAALSDASAALTSQAPASSAATPSSPPARSLPASPSVPHRKSAVSSPAAASKAAPAPKASSSKTSKVAATSAASPTSSSKANRMSLDGSKPKLLSSDRIAAAKAASSSAAAAASPSAFAPTKPLTSSAATASTAAQRRATAPSVSRNFSVVGKSFLPAAVKSSTPPAAPAAQSPAPRAARLPPPLSFESRFECGNLHRVVQVSDTAYDLVLSSDVNSRGHTQWFFFAVRGAVPGVKYRFNMLNLEKPRSTFHSGMKPVWHSQKIMDDSGIGWHRAWGVEEVAYYKNLHVRPTEEMEQAAAAEEAAADATEEGTEADGQADQEASEAAAKPKAKSGKRLVKKKSVVRKRNASTLESSPAQSPHESRSPSPLRDRSSPPAGAARVLRSPEHANRSPASPPADAADLLSALQLADPLLPLPSARRVASAATSVRPAAAFSCASPRAATAAASVESQHAELLEFDMSAAPKKKGAKSKSKKADGVAGKSRKPKSAKKASSQRGDTFYTLSFCVKFPHADDVVMLAYHYPFTATFQRECLDALQTNSALANSCMRRQRLTLTRGGNMCELVTITDFPKTRSEVEAVRKRRIVLLSARIHPGQQQGEGESNASWVMKGMLEYLAGPSETAAYLRQQCVFKLVPMLNVDGTVEGNYRYSLSGVDLNRHWHAPDAVVHPTIFATRRLLLSISVQRALLLVCDFHGHSAMKNSCLYGCDQFPRAAHASIASISSDAASLAPRPIAEQLHFRHIGDAMRGDSAANGAAADSLPPSLLSSTALAVLAAPLLLEATLARASHLFPELLARRPEMGGRFFNAASCAFTVRQAKAGTARIAFWRALRCPDVFTFEASFAGGTIGNMKGQHFHTRHYEEMGSRFGETLRELLRIRREKQAIVEQQARAAV